MNFNRRNSVTPCCLRRGSIDKLLLFWLVVLFLFGGGMTIWFAVRNWTQPPPVASGQEEVVDYGPPLEDFELVASTGEKFESNALDGKVWIASFFYASCPAVCVQQNLKVQELEQEFGRRGVKFLSITCDAETDTPERLQDYAQRFGAEPDRWIFLTGEQQYIEKVGNDIFRLPINRRGHSERLMVIDRQGEIRGAFHYSDPLEVRRLKKLVNELLKEPKPVEPAEETVKKTAEEPDDDSPPRDDAVDRQTVEEPSVDDRISEDPPARDTAEDEKSAETEPAENDTEGFTSPGADHSAVDAQPDEQPQPAHDISLTNSRGEAFQSSQLKGHVWIASFFFTNCPSCAKQTRAVHELERLLGRQGTKFVSITCDAPTDTPERLAAYAQHIGADGKTWILLTGKQKYIEKVGNEILQLPVMHRGHSERLRVIDRDGNLRGAFHYAKAQEVQELKELVNALLEEKPPRKAPSPSRSGTDAGGTSGAEPSQSGAN